MEKKIVICLSGGLVEDIRGVPRGFKVEVWDFDTEGAEDEELTVVSDSLGYKAFVRKWDFE